MKKLKKMLAVISAVAVIAASSICSVSAINNDLVEKIDVPESITTMKELEDSITYPVRISGEDELRLEEGLTIDLLKELLDHKDEIPEYEDMDSYLASASISKELAEYINTHDIYMGDVIFDARYYTGMLQIAESTTHIVYPTGWTEGDEYKIVEVPESITTMKELKDYITHPVYISPDDWLMLSYHLTIEELRELVAHFESNSDLVSDKLIKYFEENGLDDEQIDSLTKNYYKGALQIYEGRKSFCVRPSSMDKPDPEPITIVPREYLTETSGTFESGVTYFYNEETKGLIFDGSGELSEKDYNKAFRSFSNIEFIFFGNDVTFECHYGARFSAFFDALVLNWSGVVNRPAFPIFTYEGSEYTKQFDECAKEIGATIGDKEGNYKYYTVEDGTDPYTFVNTLDPLPNEINEQGIFGDDKFARWSYEGVEGYDVGLFIIYTSSLTNKESIKLEDILDITKNYDVEYAAICGTDMSVLPAELQGFDTIEEAEAELLRLINEAKSAEQPSEVTEPTETTEAAEATKPSETEAAEEKTAETVADTVDILADENAEDKTENEQGDTNTDNIIAADAPAIKAINVRTAAYIAHALAKDYEFDEDSFDYYDYNKDGKVNVRDAASIARDLSKKSIE